MQQTAQNQDPAPTVTPARPGVLAVIPARWGSSRFPGKPLAVIHGRPMIEWVWRAVIRARLVDRVLVATDDQRILDAARGFGAEACLTRSDHPSGTDRMAEVAADSPAGILVNVQGDEPLMQGEVVDAAVQALLDDPEAMVSTPVTSFRDRAELESPDTAKVVLDRGGRALYFSRSVVPHDREGKATLDLYHKHVGLYAFRREALLAFPGLTGTLEHVELLEQLRLLENGHRITTVRIEYQPLGVDRPEDLPRAEELLARIITSHPQGNS